MDVPHVQERRPPVAQAQNDEHHASVPANAAEPPSGMLSEILPTPVEQEQASGARSLSPAQLELQFAARQRTDALLRDLWKRKLPVVREQLRTLQRASDTLKDAALPAPLRSEASAVAHKLAGSLGMFGYQDGTRIARELEACLDADEPLSPTVFASLVQQLLASVEL